MTDAFHPDFAGDIVDVIAADSNITAQSPYFVTLYDPEGNELHADLQNGRVSVASADWTRTNTAFENAAEIDFGEATDDIDVQEFAIKSDDADDATATVYFKAAITSAPQSFSNGTRVFFDAGDLDVDVLD